MVINIIADALATRGAWGSAISRSQVISIHEIDYVESEYIQQLKFTC